MFTSSVVRLLCAYTASFSRLGEVLKALTGLASHRSALMPCSQHGATSVGLSIFSPSSHICLGGYQVEPGITLGVKALFLEPDYILR